MDAVGLSPDPKVATFKLITTSDAIVFPLNIPEITATLAVPAAGIR